MILLQGNAARRKGVRSMLGVGMDTHYGFYDIKTPRLIQFNYSSAVFVA